MPYPYQNILLCRWSPGCDVHYDAKPALSIPSKLSVPRIHPYWFVLVRTDTYRTVSYHTIHTYIHTAPVTASNLSYFDSIQIQSILCTPYFFLSLSLHWVLPRCSQVSLLSTILLWVVLGKVGVRFPPSPCLNSSFYLFFFSSHTEYILWAYESYKLTWIDVN